MISPPKEKASSGSEAGRVTRSKGGLEASMGVLAGKSAMSRVDKKAAGGAADEPVVLVQASKVKKGRSTAKNR